MSKLDSTDQLILATLQDNADLPNKALAEKVNLSPSACLRRVTHLKKIGAIQRIVAVIAPDCMERRLTAVVTIRFERHGPRYRRNFFKQLAREKAVVHGYMVSGEVGCVLVLNVVDMDE
jgi:Lrp/AsnC family leucine-responsive transcriptional regulator